MRLIPITLLAALLGVSLYACSGDDSDGTDTDPNSIDGLKSLSIEPADAVLEVQAGKTPSELVYKVIGTFEKGQRDITGKATLSVDNPFLGGFQAATFHSVLNQGGTTTVTAKVDALSVSTGLSIKVRAAVKDPASNNVPDDAAARFNGPASDSRKPDLVYPNDGVMMPPNMRGQEVHFLPGTGNTLFELSFRNSVTDVTVYLRCPNPLNGGCIYQPERTTWAWLAETNRGGEPLTITLRGTDDTGSAVGTADTLKLSFSAEDLTGGLYYWTTSGATAIMRYDFTSWTRATSEKYVGPELVGTNCIGCHALSRDGKKIVAEANGQNDGRLVLLDVGRKELMAPFGTSSSSPDKSIFEAWDPDGSQYAGVYADSGATDFNLMLFDGTTGKKKASLTGTGSSTSPANHPDFAPDSKRIAYVRMGVKGTNQRFGKGSIQMTTLGQSGWEAPVTLVPPQDGRNRYYPAFSPDGSFVVYDESTCPTSGSSFEKNCNADSDPSAKLFAVKAEAGATPIDMARANARGKRDSTSQLTNSFPKWAPFVYKRDKTSSARLLWFTFSSTRQFGLRNPPGGGDENPRGTLLWLSAVDPDAVARGEDPSYPAFVLPIQDISTSNHIAQWTTEVVPVIN
ncbi:TolB family protein [Hyalangium versicolor]|uniref:TolB family protein n=1 Tax=Hyalangium versicolor TaxID=2861190 RepID=UPI001CCE9FCB|nr:hypothetical protein [Hyalangium versicolor]